MEKLGNKVFESKVFHWVTPKEINDIVDYFTKNQRYLMVIREEDDCIMIAEPRINGIYYVTVEDGVITGVTLF